MSNRLAHNTLHSAIAGLSTALAGFLSNVLVARLVGVEAAGIVAFAIWAITVGVILGDLGAPGALARYLPNLRSRGFADKEDGLVHWLVRLNMTSALVICVGFLGYALRTALQDIPEGNRQGTEQPLFWILVACACMAQIVAASVNGYLKGTLQFGVLARMAVGSAVIQIGVTCVGALLFGALGALGGMIAGAIIPISFLPRIICLGGDVPPGLKYRVQRFALESWAGYLVTAFAWARMEIFFLQMNWGSHAVALFAASVTLANLATQGPLLLTGSLLPYLSQQSRQNSDRKPQETYAMSIRLLAFLIIPACLGAAAIAPALVPAIYGRDFSGAVPSTVVLLCGAAITASSSVAFTYLLAMERTRFVFLIGGVAALAVVACGLTLVPIFGVMAAASARAIIQTAVSVATIWYIGHYLNCPTPLASLMRIFAAALFCAAAAWVCIMFVRGPIGIMIAIVAGVIVYGSAIRLLKALPRSDTERLLNALTILPQPIRKPAARTLRLIAA